MTFYNSDGRPVAYTDDNEHIFLFSGIPVAYFYNDLVYAYNGEQLGRFADGQIRDLNGYCVFFTEDTSGAGPAKPAKHAKPARSAKHAKPAKSARHAPRAHAANRVSWSDLSGEQFFNV